MKTVTRCFLLVSFGLLLGSSSCDKKPHYPENSILGTWLCQEQGNLYNFRQYNVSVDYYGSDSSMIVIYNFYKLGFNVETYATLQDTVITILSTSTQNTISGTGHVKRDFSAIYWYFNYYGQVDDYDIEAVFLRP